MSTLNDTDIDGRLLGELGLTISDAKLISGNRGNALCRVEHAGGSVILKQFGDPKAAVELEAYTLLASLGVPTLRVYGQTDRAILIEDLATSADWRLAREADIELQETGTAVAGWYRCLHDAGERLVSEGKVLPTFLTREVDALDARSIMLMGERLGLAGNPVWSLGAEHIEILKEAMRSFPRTLNYNDFHWTNLALSRRRPLRAVVFDYHLLGIGPAYCDVRNVKGSLDGSAAGAFVAAYGAYDERVEVLDAPLSVLSALLVASRLDELPRWAAELVKIAASGELESRLGTAIDSLER